MPLSTRYKKIILRVARRRRLNEEAQGAGRVVDGWTDARTRTGGTEHRTTKGAKIEAAPRAPLHCLHILLILCLADGCQQKCVLCSLLCAGVSVLQWSR
jgi:hypothetical protein